MKKLFKKIFGKKETPKNPDRKISWTTHLGNDVTIEGMEDSHLANTIQFVKHRCGSGNYEILKALHDEAKLRGLTQEYLDRAPFPYKDGKGNWVIWNDTPQPKIVGSYLREESAK
jgi:hypothetical protein